MENSSRDENTRPPNLLPEKSVCRSTADAEAEDPILWPCDVKSQPIGNYPDAGKDCREVEKGATKDEMVEWHQ